MFTGFKNFRLDVNGTEINGRQGGAGPPLLLLHGHPQTHVIWHKVVEELATHFTVVATDLRGYGDSGKPPGQEDHGNYSKRVMAKDQVEVMAKLGFRAFAVLAHDRGARVAHRMAVDHPGAVQKLVTLDIAPTLAMYEQTTMTFARAYFHWFFLIRPAPFPETLIGADPECYLQEVMGSRSAGLSPFTPDAWAEYVRCIKDPAAIHGLCEDYRASAGIDLEHDRDDRREGRLVQCDLLALWGGRGIVEKCFDALHEWHRVARHVRGKTLNCGHYIPEEAPSELLSQVLPFLKG